MRGKLYFTFGLVFLFLFSPNITNAQKEDYLVINPSDFVPVFDYTDREIQTNFLACYPSTTYTWFTAPIHLPNSVGIKSIRIFYIDNHLDENIKVFIRRTNIWDGFWTNVIDSWESSGAESFLRNHEIPYTEIVGPNIDNSTYGYSVTIKLGGDIGIGFGRSLSFYNILITYGKPLGRSSTKPKFDPEAQELFIKSLEYQS